MNIIFQQIINILTKVKISFTISYQRYFRLIKMGVREIKYNGFKSFFQRVLFYFFSPHNIFIDLEKWNKAKIEKMDLDDKYDKLGGDCCNANGIKGLVSVVIPIFDRVQILKESIDSILNQTYNNYELIMVTDGSPQETMQLVETYRNNCKVKIFHYYDNTGNAGRGRNKGIKEARGEYIAFQDSDDIAEPTRLNLSVKYLEKYRADVVYGGWRAKVDTTRNDTGLIDEEEIFSPDCDFFMLLKKNAICQGTVMIRKKALLEVGGLKSKMKYREDHELWLRLAYYGAKFKAIPEILTNLRIHQGNNELNFKKDDEYWRRIVLQEYKEKSALPLKIGYIIPGMGIGGGIAVVLQHVNRLLEKGYDVFLISQGLNNSVDWIKDNKVPIIFQNNESHYMLGEIDILIAVGWTAAPIMDLMEAKRKIYFVQSDERRFFDDSLSKKIIDETYKLDCEYMTEAIWIKNWLKEEYGHDAYYIPNGIDTELFHKTEPLQCKDDQIRVLLEGPIDIPFKAVGDAYNAVKDLDCEIWIVSSSGKPKPDWRYNRFFEKVPIHEMKKIYSSCDIFLKMSKVEGFFGPPMEAMACGCAVVVGKVTGYDEYIRDGVNALVVEMGDVEGAGKAVQRLILDRALRNNLIDAGYETVKNWTWQRSIGMLEKVLSYNLNGG